MAVLLKHCRETPAPALTVAPALDPRVSGWVDRLLRKSPGERPQTSAEAWEALEEIVLDLEGPRWRRSSALPERGTRVVPGPYTPPSTPSVFETFSPTTPRLPESKPPPTVAPPETTHAPDMAPLEAEAPPRRRRRRPVVVAAVVATLGTATALALAPSHEHTRLRPAATQPVLRADRPQTHLPARPDARLARVLRHSLDVIDGASTAATYRRARRSLTGVSVGPADEADRARLARAMEGAATGRERLAEAALRESPAGYSRAAASIRRAAAALRAAVRAFVATGYAGLRSPRAPRIPPLHVTRTPVRAPPERRRR